MTEKNTGVENLEINLNEKSSMDRLDSMIIEIRAGISDKSVKDYIEFLFLKNTLIAERAAAAIKELLAKTDVETAGKFKGILSDIQILKDGMIALKLLSNDIGIIKSDQKEIGRDIKGLRRDLGYENADHNK
jgi:hypothetical protein